MGLFSDVKHPAITEDEESLARRQLAMAVDDFVRQFNSRKKFYDSDTLDFNPLDYQRDATDFPDTSIEDIEDWETADPEWIGLE